ncbi:TetR/AcrR family transcriptional regulator [Nocardia otitidiscaviarum]|uniref:TetR/AcrR family transcriptional regulator n=1 Tax=Nocardia otitidiscaviarum TaxID=1823 RepID=UPI001893AAE8|nr:TetR/AcrR family transcriptional regulator [Nocardia otitidiscaviarum]MBF6182777.1 TetR/AcrR family transcriptional regulator [Nocardia otitidiscaviarum]
MGKKGAETKARLLAATGSLMESRGYFGTGLNQILEASGAPRGSLYFHFPGGKDQIVAESLEQAGAEIAGIIETAEGVDARAYLERLVELLGDRLESSDWTKGCPVAGVALDAASSNDAVRQACSAVYQRWEEGLRRRLAEYGHPEPERLATAALALLEGGLILARAHRDRQSLRRIAATIDTLV